MTVVPYTHKIIYPNSSAISRVYYDEDTQRLYIKFVKQGFMGSLAGYSDVPVAIFNRFSQAESVGKFYNRIFLSYRFEGYDMPTTPEMIDRAELPDETPEASSAYRVAVWVTVDAPSAGAALDAVLNDITHMVVAKTEVTEL